VASSPLLSHAPTQVEVELGCDNRNNMLTHTTLTPASRNEKVINVSSDLEFDSQKVPQRLHHKNLILNIMIKNIPLALS
jgi:hypothetical protein